MKSSTLKRVGLSIWLLLIGGIWWYFLANHQFHKRASEERFYERPFFNSMHSDFMHRQRHMQDMFNDFEREFFDEYERMNDDIRDTYQLNFEDLDKETWDSKSQWVFHYYKETSENGNDTSYNLDWRWNDSEKWWNLTLSWTNEEWKDFSYSWTIHDGKSQWTLVDEDWNSKDLNLDELNLKEIYDDSNSISD